MTGVRTPGFTAEESLGIFLQEYQLARAEREEISLITTQAYKRRPGPVMMPQNKYCCDKEGICGCVCPRDGGCSPCTGHDCNCWCE